MEIKQLLLICIQRVYTGCGNQVTGTSSILHGRGNQESGLCTRNTFMQRQQVHMKNSLLWKSGPLVQVLLLILLRQGYGKRTNQRTPLMRGSRLVRQ